MTRPQSVEDLRALVAAGTRKAATVYRANAEHSGATALADRLDARAKELDAGAAMGRCR